MITGSDCTNCRLLQTLRRRGMMVTLPRTETGWPVIQMRELYAFATRRRDSETDRAPVNTITPARNLPVTFVLLVILYVVRMWTRSRDGLEKFFFSIFRSRFGLER